MLFNSLHFLLFFVIVTGLYFIIEQKFRWLLLLLASCYFYMAYVPIYLVILLFTIAIDYTAGILIESVIGYKRKVFLWVSIIANISVLATFKYYSFFHNELSFLLEGFALVNPLPYLTFLLPIGLSFHTFQAMSYTIEVFRGHQKAERHLGIYALYVMYYPQLVAGPIERPQNLLHQFQQKAEFSIVAFKAGLWLMAWGLFKKVVIADRLAIMVDYAYADYETINALSFLVASVFYSFQIYCDFSGYSDIAIGASAIMGIKLMTNFNLPYLSQSLTEFWRRWHISLSTWFRDYLFVPLGGSATGNSLRTFINLITVFLISGLWHGAAWTFIIWGLIHGIGVIMERIIGVSKRKHGYGIKKYFAILFTFSIVTLAWVFFRAPDFSIAIQMLSSLLHFSFNDKLELGSHFNEILFAVFVIAILLLKEKLILNFSPKNNWQYFGALGIMVACCYLFGVFNQQQFIYFQF